MQAATLDPAVPRPQVVAAPTASGGLKQFGKDVFSGTMGAYC